MKKRHRWNAVNNGKGGKDSSSVYCLKCGMVKQWIGGRPTYFRNHTLVHYAPPCDEITLQKQNDLDIHELVSIAKKGISLTPTSRDRIIKSTLLLNENLDEGDIRKKKLKKIAILHQELVYQAADKLYSSWLQS